MKMDFAVESWGAGYGFSGSSEEELDPFSDEIDCNVEPGLDDWKPIDPGLDGERPASIVFIDGIRRIDSRVWITDQGLARPGLCATVAAGAVRCTPDSAEVAASISRRGLYTAVGSAEPITTTVGETYKVRPTSGDDDQALSAGIQNHMTELELDVSTQFDDETLVVFDGPLRGRDTVAGVGYIKTQHVQYLDADLQPVVGQLRAGQRTPIFSIGGAAPRWSWYMRLPGPISHPMSGVVRLEVPQTGPADSAADRADQISKVLPRYASEAHKDQRAPQNLYPIAGLERELRRRLGDVHLLERSLRVAGRRSGAQTT